MTVSKVTSSPKSRTQKRFIEPPAAVVALAEKHAFEDFPKIADILTVARIESSFRENAKHGPSNGVMQVNHGPFELKANIAAGVKLLREYYLMLGSVKAAIIAYNAGPGNYRKGRYQLTYWNSYKEHLNGYTDWYEASASNELEVGVEPDLRSPATAFVGPPVFDGVLDANRSLFAEDWEASPH